MAAFGKPQDDKDRIIVALDVPSFEEAQTRVQQLAPLGLRHFKVGFRLFTAAGPDVVKMIHDAGADVFLDLKFHDIPNTVAQAVESAAGLGVWMTNLHCQGGSEMMRAAMGALEPFGEKVPITIGVTVLTSMQQEDLEELKVDQPVAQHVLYLAELAKAAGMHGVVASAQEATAIREKCGEDFVLVTPGIRLQEGADDQKRVMTPSKAIAAGSDYLVIGRPILAAQDPEAAVELILQDCASCERSVS